MSRSRRRICLALAVCPIFLPLSCASQSWTGEPDGQVIASVELAIGGDLGFASVQVCGARATVADGKYRCESSLPTAPCPCFNLGPGGGLGADGGAGDGGSAVAPVVFDGLCASSNVPSSDWAFTYAIFDDVDCTGTQVNDGLHHFTCYDSFDLALQEHPNETIETLSSGLNANKVLCIDPPIAGAETDAAAGTGIGDAGSDGGYVVDASSDGGYVVDAGSVDAGVDASSKDGGAAEDCSDDDDGVGGHGHGGGQGHGNGGHGNGHGQGGGDHGHGGEGGRGGHGGNDGHGGGHDKGGGAHGGDHGH